MDKLAIFNMAVSLAGGRSVLSSVNAVKVEAEQCRLWYDISRDFIFRRAYWPSLRETTALAVVAENDFADNWTAADPPLPWRFAYAAPANMLSARFINSADGSVHDAEFQQQYMIVASVRTKVILTDCPTAVLTYTLPEDNPEAWDVNLQMAVINQLAANITSAVSGSPDFARASAQRAESYTILALENQANADQQNITLPQGDILQSRSGYYPGTNLTSGQGQ